MDQGMIESRTLGGGEIIQVVFILLALKKSLNIKEVRLRFEGQLKEAGEMC